MMTLIIGGSGSGKSAYAEEYITEISEGCEKYYIATMQAFDREGREKVKRHRRMRNGKGFSTIEQPLGIEKALEKMSLQKTPKTALLECMSNLAANEMFSGDMAADGSIVAERIIGGVERLNKGLKHLVIVSNNVFEDGVIYDECTMEYIRAMGNINEKLAGMAERVIEVVVGIPLWVDGYGRERRAEWES
ncbi:MAG: bifunctional adenosylcobinamide kinase/adenosylcobinamide-phosphate guanylyltransferase [Bacteroidales bacterium]|nr:bifunctional adenosylcobinamide kinase/adenosylcobinamide-phosphate guanylyltransferase [Lachnoclostridium sp.]MCM1384252.1 bifunctional adenosylcobinamide kinase/adenosylcobinamide-phosphate guanylyltransferase [Lachnoclostridium sp.]MCM1464751.1 bifunctional adenosylcobinamide kinase/adenosylcobinamide-phosphate guanylyltransferase [Bacteroidales bacterium]